MSTSDSIANLEPAVEQLPVAVPRKAPGAARKWLAIGTGVGIEIRGDDLQVAVVKVRPNGIRILGAATIARFRQRPATEWGVEYADFLAKCGTGHLAATVLLPREELIVRPLSLPGVNKRDTEAAIRFQIDSLHPYPEDEVQYGWGHTGDTGSVLVGIARTQVVDRYATLFAEAGIRVSSFTFSAAVLYAAIRILVGPPEGGFMILEPHISTIEIYGESGARPVFSAVFDVPAAKAVGLAGAELRLEGQVQPYRAAELLPTAQAGEETPNVEAIAFSYAAAVAAACPWLAVQANLLPVAQRSTTSRTVYIPTIALASLLVIAIVFLVVYGRVEDKRYQAALEAEISKLTPQAAKVRELEKQIEALRARRQVLNGFRSRTRADLDAVRELTKLIEPPGWLNSLDMNRSTVMINGEAAHAATLLETIDRSPLFRGSEFLAPISKAGQAESFAVRFERETPPVAQPGPAAASKAPQGSGK